MDAKSQTKNKSRAIKPGIRLNCSRALKLFHPTPAQDGEQNNRDEQAVEGVNLSDGCVGPKRAGKSQEEPDRDRGQENCKSPLVASDRSAARIINSVATRVKTPQARAAKTAEAKLTLTATLPSGTSEATCASITHRGNPGGCGTPALRAATISSPLSTNVTVGASVRA